MLREQMAKTAQLSQFDEELYKVTGDQADKYLIAVCDIPRLDWAKLTCPRLLNNPSAPITATNGYSPPSSRSSVYALFGWVIAYYLHCVGMPAILRVSAKRRARYEFPEACSLTYLT